MWILYVKGQSRGAGITLHHLPSLPHHPVRTVSSPSEAVERLAQGGASYDLVLMDYCLSDGDCTGLLRQIRAMGLTQEIIVLIEAGKGVKAAAKAALMAGANDYVIQRNDYLERLRRKLTETPHQRRLRVALHDAPLLALYVGQAEEDVANIHQCILRQAPYVYLDVARSWNGALERVASSDESGEYDVILLDPRLPKLDVSEALQDLYQRRKLDIPLVLIAEEGKEEMVSQAISLGAAGYVLKNNLFPFLVPAELESACHRAERARARVASGEEDTAFRPLIENMPVGVLLHGRQGEINYCNHAAVEMLGLSEEQLLGKTSLSRDCDLIWEDGSPYPEPAYLTPRVFMTCKPIYNAVMGVLLSASNKRRWLNVNAVPCVGADGRLRQVLCTLNDITERKQAEEALRQSDRRLHLAQRAAKVGNWEWNLLTGESHWSEGLYNLLGLESGEGKVNVEDFIQFIHPVDRAEALGKVESVIKDGEYYDCEFRIVRRDGTVAWLASKGHVIRSASGRAEWMIGVNIDITERKRTEAAHAESERLLREAQEIARMGSFYWEAATNAVAWSDELYRVYGLTPGETKITYDTYLKQVHPDHQQQVRRAVERAIHDHEPFGHEYRIIWPTGETRWVFARCRPVFNADGTLLALQGICQDITDRKRAEEALHESEHRYRTLFEKASDAILLATENDEILDVNQRACELLGYSREELLARKVYELLAPEMNVQAVSVVADRLEKYRDMPAEAIDLRRNGQRISVEVINTQIGSGGQVLSIVRDISERKRAELQRQGQNTSTVEPQGQQPGFAHIIGRSDVLRAMIRIAEKIAATAVSPVLITGETGTGKGLIAYAIHRATHSMDFAFSHIDCTSIPETLFESELFGHEQGAFTDARKSRRGRLELAKNGTVFLDEISEIPLNLQAKLLQVLQDGVFHRVGGREPIKLDARVIAATNRDLRAEVAAGRFRADLYQRLFVVQIDVPPLRHREDDALLLAEHFLTTFNQKYRKNIRQIAPQAIEALRFYSWPGNVRELEHAIERAVLFEESEQITLKYLRLESEEPVGPLHSGIGAANPPKKPGTPAHIEVASGTLDQINESIIRQMIAECGGNIAKSARRLGISRSRIYRVLQGSNYADPSSGRELEEDQDLPQFIN